MTWPVRALGEIVTLYGGGTPSKSRQEFWMGDMPWVSPKDMQSREIFDTEDHVSAEAVAQSATQQVPAGSVLLVVRSGILMRHLPIAIARRVVTLNQDMKALVPEQSVLTEYLAYTLEAQSAQILSHCVKRGATVHSLDIAKLKQIKVPVPPILVQQRIVDVLDKANSLRRLRDDADAKAERILPSLFVKIFGDPESNPRGFPVRPLSEYFDGSPNYGTMVPPTLTPKGWLDIRVKNINGGFLDLSDKKYVDLDERAASRHTLKNRDLILVRAIASRDHLGKCAVVYPGNEQWAFDSHIMRVRFKHDELAAEYVWAYLNTPPGRRSFLRTTRESAIQFNINVPEFSAIAIPIPPPGLQREFLQYLVALRENAVRRRAAREATERLFSSIMGRCFAPRSQIHAAMMRMVSA